MRALLPRFLRAKAASALTAFALFLPVLIGASAFAVDVGVFFLERRALQKAADAAALAAAADPDRAGAIVRRMLESNNQGDARFAFRFGRYRADPSLSRDERFEEGGEANAVSVEASREVPALFGRIFGTTSATIGVRSQAAVTPVVSFAIGSRLLSADPPLVDILLKRLTGASLGLDLVDYRGLARSDLRLMPLLRGLAGASGLSPDVSAGAVLRRPIRLSVFLSVAAAELAAAGDPVGAGALRKAAHHTLGAALEVEPGDLVGLDEGFDDLRIDYPGDALGARVSALSLLSAAVTDRGIGNAVSATLGLSGLVRADVELLLGEAEQAGRAAAIGRFREEGPSAGTAQARLRLQLHADAAAVLPGGEAAIPVELVAAGARATVVSATCSADPAKREVRVAVHPGLVRLSLGRSDKALDAMAIGDKVHPATIAAGPALRIEAGGSVALKRLTPAYASFRGSEIGDGTVKTVRTRNLAESLVVTLIGETEIGVRVGGLGLDLGLPETLKRTARTLLGTLVRPVDAVLDAVLASAGIGLGEADIRVDDLVCGHARLVG